MEFMPDTYIVNNDSVLFANLHNEVLNVLVSQGIVGLLIMVALVVAVLKNFFQKYKYTTEKNRKSIAILMGIVVGSAAGAMFISHMIYTFSASSPMFWLCLGYMVYLLKNADINKLEVE